MTAIDEAASAVDRLIRGQMLKYIDWRYLAGRERTPLALGTRLAALAETAFWQRWEGQESKEIIPRPPGGVLPYREDLSHRDESQWPIGLSGDRTDPWQNSRAVYFADPKTAQIYTFLTSSWGGRSAVADLSGQIARMRLARPGAVPIVELQATEMPTRFGMKSRPDFRAVEWVGGDEAPTVELPAEAMPKPLSEEQMSRRRRMKDQPYGAFGKGQKPLTQNVLAYALKEFGIRSGTVRLSSGYTLKGYYLRALEDAFSRYLPISAPEPSQRHNAQDSSSEHVTSQKEPSVSTSHSWPAGAPGRDDVTDAVSEPPHVSPSNSGRCDVVTDESPICRGLDRGSTGHASENKTASFDSPLNRADNEIGKPEETGESSPPERASSETKARLPRPAAARKRTGS
jgi:hypothetical protein